jgi:predicted transglutaminase-like cysteine proteinase
MAKRNGIAARLSTISISIALLIAGLSTSLHARGNSRAAWPNYTVVVEKAKKEGPPGWVEFCRNYKSECDAQSSEPRKILLTPEVWSKLGEVNRWANTHIKPVDDRVHWGRDNRWYFADDGKGDCKDYVLVKRRMLMKSGLPREALLMTAVLTPRDGHAILIVRTDKGDYVLDSLTSKIVLWKDTPYEFIMRQSQSNPNVWLYIDALDPLKPPPIADKSIAENPLDEPVVMITGLDSGSPKQELIAARSAERDKAKPDVIASRGMSDGTSSSTEPIPGGVR